MAEIISFIGDVFSMTIGTIGEGEAAVEITLGLMLAAVLVIGLGLSVYRRLRGRG